MNFRKFFIGCLFAWATIVGFLGLFDTLKHREAQAAPRLLTWGLDTGVSPANVCLYYTSAACFNIGTMSAGGAFAMPPANLAAMPAETVLGNGTNASASPTALALPFSQPLGRLTLQSGVPVMTTNTAGATTVYYTPYNGYQIALPDGVAGGMVSQIFTELSQLTTDATKSPAAVAASSCYDIFVWNDAGTLRATRGAAWTNCTSRGAGMAAIGRINGTFVNTNTITNGPPAKMGVWVGAIASNAGSTIDYIFGAASSGGTAARLEVCNAFNRQQIFTQVVDSGTAYTYSSATIRQARASAGNQASFMSCSAADSVFVGIQTECATTAAANTGCDVGFGFDTTASFNGTARYRSVAPTAAVFTTGQTVSSYWQPGVGVHVISSNESSVGAVANTFSNGGINVLSLTLQH